MTHITQVTTSRPRGCGIFPAWFGRRWLLATLLVALAGCGSGGTSTETEATTLRAVAGVVREGDAAESLTLAEAVLRISPDRQRITLTVNTTRAARIGTVEIHVGRTRQVGPAIFTAVVVDGVATSITTELTPADLIARPDYGINTFEDALTVLLNGQAYLIVRTDDRLLGTQRGQIGAIPFQATLTPVRGYLGGFTLPTGTAIAGLNAEQTVLAVTVHASGLSGVLAVELRLGTVDEPGPVLFTLFSSAEGAEIPATLTRALGEEDLQAQPSRGINSFADAVNALQNGGTYLEIRTRPIPEGEIRGQLVPY